MAPGLKLTVLTLFPELLERYFATSILGKAVTSGRVTARAVDIREYASDRRRTCDDAPYGGGAGMVLMPEPLGRALDAVDAAGQHVLFPNPAGKRFTQADAWRLAQRDEIVLICGRYEGVDQRIIDLYVDEEVSIGDYVISSGELAAMVIIDAVYRLRDGMLRESSVSDESFEDGLLEYPHYTRPEHFRGRDVPEVLISGHHANIERWRRRQRIIRTARHRPDLLAEAPLSDEEIRFVREELGRSE